MPLPDGRNWFWFAVAPVEVTDFRVLGNQFRGFTQEVARALNKAGLLGAEDPAVLTGHGGIRDALGRATSCWTAKWAPVLAAGWRTSAPDEGLTGKIGGLLVAAWSERLGLVRETCVIGLGWGLLTSVWLGLLWAAFAWAITPAMAAASGTDLARTALGDMLPFLETGGTLLSQGLGKIVGTLSTIAALVATAAVLVSLLIMLIEAATNPDNMRGKYDWAMFALRSVVVIALLMPLGGSWGAGAQLVGWAAGWGSDKASEAWAGMTSYLANKDKWVSKPHVGEMEATVLVSSLVTAEACRAGINLDPKRSGKERVTLAKIGPDVVRYDYELNHWYGWSTEISGGCGTVSYADKKISGTVGEAVTPAILSAHRTTFEQIRTSVSTEVDKLIKIRLACRDEPTKCEADPAKDTIGGLVTAYRTKVETAIAKEWQTVSSNIATRLTNGVTDKGWFGAGEWALTLSNLQGSLGAAGNAVPRLSSPILTDVEDAIAAAQTWLGEAFIASGNKVIQAQLAATSGQPSASDDMLTAFGTDLWALLAEVQTMNPIAALSATGQKVWVIGLAVLTVTEVITSDDGGGVEKATKTGTNLLKSAAQGVKGVVSWGVQYLAKSAMGKAAKAMKPILVGGAMALIITGLGLAYLVPSLPFIRFLFAAISWLIAVLECVVLVVVMLVIVVTPEAGGFLGPHARSAFMNVVALVLRPILTLAGFIAGLVLTSVAVGLLNGTMLPMIRDLNDGNTMFIGFVAYMLIYLGTAYVIVNVCTKTPDTLATAAYRWLGANSGGGGDDGAAVGSSVSNVAQSIMREVGMRARGNSKDKGKKD